MMGKTIYVASCEDGVLGVYSSKIKVVKDMIYFVERAGYKTQLSEVEMIKLVNRKHYTNVEVADYMGGNPSYMILKTKIR